MNRLFIFPCFAVIILAIGTDLRKMHMAKSILALFIVASIICFAANILGKEYFDTAPWLVLIPAATFFTLLFLLGYAGHRQNFTIQCLILETTNDIELPTSTEDVTTEMQEEEVNEEVKWCRTKVWSSP